MKKYFDTVAAAVVALALCACVSDGEVSDESSDGGSDTDGDIDTSTFGGTDMDTDTLPLTCEGGRYDASTGLCWQHPCVRWFDLNEAMDYCESLERGGHDDWYLPSRDEMLGLLDDCEKISHLDGGGYDFQCKKCSESQVCNELFEQEKEIYRYWSSTKKTFDCFWEVRLYEGLSDWAVVETNFGNSVRCVRQEL